MKNEEKTVRLKGKQNTKPTKTAYVHRRTNAIDAKYKNKLFVLRKRKRFFMKISHIHNVFQGI